MLRTLDRYVIREILPPMFLSLLIFTFILEIPPVMDQLEQLVAKGVPWATAGRMLLTLLPQALGLTIPMSLLVGLLIGLGRMSGDREAVALLACGVSPYRLLRPILLLATVAGGVHLWVMLSAIPDANQTFRQITYDVISQQVENDVRPQVFFTNFPNLILYTRDVVPGGGGWKDVLVADTRKPTTDLYHGPPRPADPGPGQADGGPGPRGRQPVLAPAATDGKEVEIYRFPENLTVTLDPKSVFPAVRPDAGHERADHPAALRSRPPTSSSNSLPAHQEMEAIQQQFSFPAACLVFAVIGVALGLTVARDGKLAGFVVGIAVIFAYYIFLYLAESVTKGYYSGPSGGAQPLLARRSSRAGCRT